MIKVVGITFKKNGKVYFFNPNGLCLKKGQAVIVETDKGIQYGYVAIEERQMKKENITSSLKSVVRLADKKDEIINNNNLKAHDSIMKKCNELIKKHNLDMKLTDVNYTFDRKQLFFYYISDERIDFRELAKELAQIYKTRIELRQIGVRDQAKEIGGLGPCGRQLCCNKFLNSFDTVTISMAKNQNLALTPSKINGSCGRLLCCLNYEDDNYKEYKKAFPEIGQIVKTEKGKGKVISIDVFQKTYRVYIEDFGVLEVSLKGKKK